MENENQYFYASQQPQQQPQKPKKKKWPIVAGVAGAVVVAGGAATAYAAFAKSPAMKTPVEAMTTCMAQLDEQFSSKKINTSALADKLDVESLYDNIVKDGGEMEGSITFEDSDYKDLAMLKGVTLGFSSKNDVKNNNSSANINASFMGFSGDIGVYTDEDMIALTSDEFLEDAYVSVKMDDLIEKIEDATGEDFGDLQERMGQQSAEILTDSRDFSDYVAKQLPDSLVSFAKDWDIEEDGKKNLEIGDDKYESYVYHVTISSEAFHDFLEDYCGYLAEYDYEGNSLFAMYDEAYKASGMDSYSDMIKKGLEELPDMVDEDSDESLDMMMYLSKKGELLGMEMSVEEDEDELSMEWFFGGENPGQDVYITVSGKADGSDIGLNMYATTTTEDKVEISDFSLDFEVDDEVSGKISAVTNYNTKDDSFDSAFTGKIEADGEAYSVDIKMEGAYDKIEKGRHYDMNIDSLSIEIDSDDELPFTTMEFSGELSYGVLEDALEKPEGKEYNVLDLSDKDISELAKTIKKSSVISTLESMAGVDIEDLLTEALSELKDFDFEDLDLDSLDLDGYDFEDYDD